MKTRIRRFFEFTILVTLFSGTGFLCYETGRHDLLSAPPAAVQPAEPPAPVVEEEKPEITDEQPKQESASLPQITIRGTPFFVSAQNATGPSLPVQEPVEDVQIAIKPKDACGPEPGKLETKPETQPLPQAQQQAQQQAVQCNCRRCRRMYGW